MARYIKTRDGRVDSDLLRPEVVEAHDYVMEMQELREKISKLMKEAKAKEKELTAAYLSKKAEVAGLDEWNGFASDYSIDKVFKVETKFAEIVAIDTNVSTGIQIIADWVENLQPNLNKKIKVILQDVLSVRSTGSISKSQLQKLCSYGFDDPKYKEGVRMIMSNMTVIDRKSYTEVYSREDIEEDRGAGVKVYTNWVKIPVNYAGM